MPVPFPEIPRVDPDEVKRRLDSGEKILIVDIRKPEAYAADHIAGAVSVPLATIVEGQADLPRDRDLVFY
jgi:rhodanese-related sulfurtransferase